MEHIMYHSSFQVLFTFWNITENPKEPLFLCATFLNIIQKLKQKF